jgi:hypothetical protein
MCGSTNLAVRCNMLNSPKRSRLMYVCIGALIAIVCAAGIIGLTFNPHAQKVNHVVVFGAVNLGVVSGWNGSSSYIFGYYISGNLTYAANNTKVVNAVVTLTLYNGTSCTTLTGLQSGYGGTESNFGTTYYFVVDTSYVNSTAVLSANGAIMQSTESEYYPQFEEFNQFPPCNVTFNVYADTG